MDLVTLNHPDLRVTRCCFRNKNFLHDRVVSPMQNPQTWRAGRLLFVWPLTFDLSGMGVPTSTSRGPASIALGLIGARKHPHHVKVAIFGDEETLEVDWPCRPLRSFHCKNCYALDARRETQAGSPQDHMATDSWEGNKGDGEDLGAHKVHGKGSPDVEGTRCRPTCLLGVKDMRESER